MELPNPMELMERIARQDPGQASAVRQNDSGQTLQDPKLKVRLFKTGLSKRQTSDPPVATGSQTQRRSKSPRNFPIHNDKQQRPSKGRQIPKDPISEFRIRYGWYPARLQSSLSASRNGPRRSAPSGSIPLTQSTGLFERYRWWSRTGSNR